MNILRAAIIGSVLMIGCAASALAADYAPPEAAPTPEQYKEMGFYLRGDAGWSFLQWGDNDNAPTIGGGVGYQFNPYLRSDVRVDWSGNYDVGRDANLNMTTVLGNLYVDLPTDSIFTPYAGAGVGYGWANIDNQEDQSGIAYSLMAGVSIDLSESLEADVGYRYRGIDDDGENPTDHSILGGLRFKF